LFFFSQRGRPYAAIERMLNDENRLTAQGAKKFNLIDNIIIKGSLEDMCRRVLKRASRMQM